MESTGINFSEVYTSIGNTLGVPVALAFFWLVWKIKELSTKVKILEKDTITEHKYKWGVFQKCC